MSLFEKTTIGKPKVWLIEAAAAIGLDFSNLTHEITSYFKNHSIKRHGDSKIEKARGQLPVTLADFDKIPNIVKSPDCVIIGIKRKNEILIAYSKKFEEETIIYYEEILNSHKNKALRSKTMYKKMGNVHNDTFLKIVENNAHTDITNIKVVGAGGYPGGEAE